MLQAIVHAQYTQNTCSSDIRWMDDTNDCVTLTERASLPGRLKSGLEHTAKNVNARSFSKI